MDVLRGFACRTTSYSCSLPAHWDESIRVRQQSSNMSYSGHSMTSMPRGRGLSQWVLSSTCAFHAPVGSVLQSFPKLVAPQVPLPLVPTWMRTTTHAPVRSGSERAQTCASPKGGSSLCLLQSGRNHPSQSEVESGSLRTGGGGDVAGGPSWIPTCKVIGFGHMQSHPDNTDGGRPAQLAD